MSKKAKHASLPKDLKRVVGRFEKLPVVTKIVLGIIERCRHRFRPGSVKFLGEERGGFHLKGYFSGGVMSIFLVCENEDKDSLRRCLTVVKSKKKAKVAKKAKASKKRKKTYTVIRQEWLETERGWGAASGRVLVIPV